MSDPAYQHELDELAALCRGFVAERHRDPLDMTPQLLLVGAIVGQAANIYNLSPPGGMLNPGEMFTGGPAQPRTSWRLNEMPSASCAVRLVVDTDDPEVLASIEDSAAAVGIEMDRE